MDPVWGVKGAHKSCGDHVGPPQKAEASTANKSVQGGEVVKAG